jgi:hypothetical protein
MRYLKEAAVGLFVLLSGYGLGSARGQEPFRVSDQQVAQLLARLDTQSESFHQHLEEAIVRGFLNDAEIGQYLKRFVGEFEQLTDRLKERSQDGKPTLADVQEVLNRGPYLDTFMRSYDFGPEAERDWQLIYAELSQLASYYKLETYWGVPTTPGQPINVDLEALANRLIGTYELDGSRSDDVRAVVERAVNELPLAERRRALTTLLPHLRLPARLALDRQQNTVTLASSLRPARVYAATGRAHTGKGGQEQVMLYGDQFRLNTVGEAGVLYSETYTTIEQGARLHVTQTALISQLRRPVVVVSYYKKRSDVPQLNLDTEEPNDNGVNPAGTRKKPRR